YTVSSPPASAGTGDLLVEPCTVPEGTPPAPLIGVLTATAPTAAAAVGESQSLPSGETITLRAVQLRGPGEDATLPAGQALVVVTLAAPATLDYPLLA